MTPAQRSDSNHVRKIKRLAIALGAILILVGCGDDVDPPITGPGPVVTPGPQFPQVGGSWRGRWESGLTGASATLFLQQNRDRLSGELTIGRRDYSVEGTVSQFGEVRLLGRGQFGGCTVYFTEGSHLGLTDRSGRLNGPLRINEAPNCGGRVLSRGGRLDVEKIF